MTDEQEQAMWLGIQCIAAYNGDTEESSRAISILTDMIESQTPCKN